MDRKEYLKQWRAKNGKNYYNLHKAEILQKQREKREKEKGQPLRSCKKINLKGMTQEQKKAYYRQKVRECRERKKQQLGNTKKIANLQVKLNKTTQLQKQWQEIKNKLQKLENLKIK